MQTDTGIKQKLLVKGPARMRQLINKQKLQNEKNKSAFAKQEWCIIKLYNKK
jgi:hypothetical protein